MKFKCELPFLIILRKQMVNFEWYCTEFGLYTSDKDASDFLKVPTPSLAEIQEAQSDSILSLREVFNYWFTFPHNLIQVVLFLRLYICTLIVNYLFMCKILVKLNFSLFLDNCRFKGQTGVEYYGLVRGVLGHCILTPLPLQLSISLYVRKMWWIRKSPIFQWVTD